MQINRQRTALVARAACCDRAARGASAPSIGLLLSVLVIVMAGCRGSGAGDPPNGAVALTHAASEFSVEIIVRAGDGRADLHAGVENRNGHYVLLADGSLHAASSGRGMPPRRRVLVRDELDNLHAVIRAIEDRPDRTDPHRIAGEMPADRVLSISVDVRKRDDAWMVYRTYGPGDAVDREIAGLVRRLAALAWMPDVPPEGQPLAPRRYDLGPDPYARYRPAARSEGS